MGRKKQFAQGVSLNMTFVTKIIIFSSFIALLFIGSCNNPVLPTYGQTSPAPQMVSMVPHAKLIYNGKDHAMFPFVFVDNSQLNKLLYPSNEPDDDNPPLILQKGTTIGFDFDKQPISVDAFVTDYDSSVPSLYKLRKIGANEFELGGPNGVYNLEVHSFFADGQYTSHTVLVELIGGNPQISQSSHQSNQSFNSSAISNNTFKASSVQSQCDSLGRIDVAGISDSYDTKTGILSNTLDDNLGSTWSVRGIDVMTYEKSLLNPTTSIVSNESPWLQLDLGADKTICNLGLAFNNGDKSVNFFNVQISSDGQHFTNLGTVESTPSTAGGQLFVLPDLPATARYVRISDLGNMVGGAPVSISEVAAIGK
jgi:F5/8 type C domain